MSKILVEANYHLLTLETCSVLFTDGLSSGIEEFFKSFCMQDIFKWEFFILKRLRVMISC